MTRKHYELSTQELIDQFALIEDTLVNKLREDYLMRSPKKISSYVTYMNATHTWARWFIEDDVVRELKGRVDPSVIHCYMRILKNRSLLP